LENAVLTLFFRFCFVSAIGLLVWVGVSMVVSENATPPRKALVIEKLEWNLGDQPVGTHLVTFHVRNTTQQPQRIIGMAER
jgi:hypothetical protein